MSTSSPAPRASGRSTRNFLLGFLAVALLIAGGLSYLASSSPDGLDSVALHGCEVVETAEGEQLDGACLAKEAGEKAGEHATAGSPFADYTLGGAEGTVGIAGVIGVLVTALLAGGVFWLLARHRTISGATPAAAAPADAGPAEPVNQATEE